MKQLMVLVFAGPDFLNAGEEISVYSFGTATCYGRVSEPRSSQLFSVVTG